MAESNTFKSSYFFEKYFHSKHFVITAVAAASANRTFV